jgi:hypothetical protein
MTRSVWVITGAVAGVAVVLLGAWLVLAGRGSEPTGSGPPPATVASTTELSWPPDPSDGSNPPDSYPTVPSAQMRGEHLSAWMARTDDDGRRLLVQVLETNCSTDEVRLLGEHTDRVEVEIRTVATSLPAHPGSGKGFVCGGVIPADGPYAVVDLNEPLGERTVVIHRVP